MEILQSIQKIHPTLEFDKDFIVFDNSDGKGQQLQWLNTEISQPTTAQLETAWVEVQKELVLKQQKAENEKALVEKLGGDDKFNAFVKFTNILATDFSEKYPESNTAKALQMVNETLNK